jgi:TPR repeat protein
MFEQGKGVPLDYVAAYSWHSVAATAGERHSAARLKSLSHVMLAEQMRVAKARAVAWQAQHGKPAGVRESQSVGAISFLPEK